MGNDRWHPRHDRSALAQSQPDGPAPRDLIIHHLHEGHTPCLMPGVPSDWPKDEKWSDNWPDVTCAGCLAQMPPGQLVARLTWDRLRHVMNLSNRRMRMSESLSRSRSIERDELVSLRWLLAHAIDKLGGELEVTDQLLADPPLKWQLERCNDAIRRTTIFILHKPGETPR